MQRHGTLYLLDCGEGTQYRLREEGYALARIAAIFITHLHGDHCFGLPGLLSSMALNQRQAPLTLVAPAPLDSMLQALPGLDPDRQPFPIERVLLDESLTQQTVYAADGLRVTARPLTHRTFTAGYRVDEDDRPGRFFPEKARALGVTDERLFGTLQRGTPVTRDDGTVVHPRDVMGPPRPGVTWAYVTDTRPCAAGRALARHADLLVHDATFSEAHRARAADTGHSTAREAARVAQAAGAKQLALTHFSARYPTPEVLVEEARDVFSASVAAEEGRPFVLDPRETSRES